MPHYKAEITDMFTGSDVYNARYCFFDCKKVSGKRLAQVACRLLRSDIALWNLDTIRVLGSDVIVESLGGTRHLIISITSRV